MVPLHNAREFSGQSFSAMNKRFFSLGKSSLSLCHTRLRVPLSKHMHVSFTKMPALSYTICIFEGAL